MVKKIADDSADVLGIKTLFLLIAVVIGVLIFSKFFGLEHEAFVAIKLYANKLYVLTQQHQLLASLMFVLLFIACVIFFIPVTVVLALLAGFLFGTFWGAFLVTLGVTTGSLIVLQLVRALYANRVKQRYPRQVEKFDREISKYGGRYILGAHLLPFSPIFLINIVAGALAVPAWTFAWSTALGTLPGTIMYTLAGRSLHGLSSIYEIAGVWILIGMTAMGIAVLASRFFMPRS